MITLMLHNAHVVQDVNGVCCRVIIMINLYNVYYVCRVNDLSDVYDDDDIYNLVFEFNMFVCI